MTFSDRLTQLRKTRGWSQEELADRMDVTRQAVSKWESGPTTPELDKIVTLSELFAVSTDYLLKGGGELSPVPEIAPAPEDGVLRTVTLADAREFLACKAQTALPMAIAVFLCIISPAALLVLLGLSELPGYGVTSSSATAVGVVAILLLVAAASAIFVSNGLKTQRFECLGQEPFRPGPGVVQLARERMEALHPLYTRCLVIGICLCILSAVPLLSCALFYVESPLPILCSVAVLLLFVGVGVAFIIRGVTEYEGCKILLQEDNYSIAENKRASAGSAFSGVYWLAVTAAFLAYSFLRDDWDRSWIIWPVAGVLFPVLLLVVRAAAKPKEKP